MSEGLNASRKSLEAQRKKALADIDATNVEIAAVEQRLGLLTSRRTFLEGQVAEFTVGIEALQEVQRGEAVA